MSAIQATVSLQAGTEGQMALQISVVQCNLSDHPQQAKHTWSFDAAGLPVEVSQYFKSMQHFMRNAKGLPVIQMR